MLNLLVSTGLFAGLIVMAVIAVGLSIGLAVMLFIKSAKSGQTVEADAVKQELYGRETDLVIKIITEKAEGKAKEELISELRRIRSAEVLVDEIIRTEKTERGIVDKPAAAAKRPAGRPVHRPAVRPAAKPAASAQPEAEAEVAATQTEAPVEEAPVKKAAKPAPKKKTDGKETPSDN